MGNIKFIDIPFIASKNLTWNVFVGGRRNGKTYGILERLMKEKPQFLYLRRTEKELTKAVNEGIFEELNFNLGLEYNVEYYKSEGFGYIFSDAEQKHNVGKLYAMSTIRSSRGVDFNKYDEMFFDEFIPEKSAITHDYDGETCINAFETIFSNRELPPNPRPPMKVWMACNSINLFDPILNALNLAEPVAQMEISGEKTKVVPERSLFLYHGTEESVAEAKKKTSLYRMIGAESSIAENMLYGKFSGDYVNAIRKKVNLRLYNCAFDIDGKVFVYVNKHDGTWYVSTAAQPSLRHFNSKVPFDLRKRHGIRYRYLKSIDMVSYENVGLIEFMDAFLD